MNIVQTDIKSVIEKKDLFTSLSNSTVLITGATGFIGSMIIKTIYAAEKKYGLGIRVVGQIRNRDKAKILFGESYNNGIKFIKKPDAADIYDFIIHTVSPTSSRFFIEHPVETIKASVESAMDVLELSKASGSSLVYLSSMEQYGIPYETGQRMTEDMIGIIDHLNIRASYSESKRLCECLCASYAAEYNVDVKIARLAQTFGAGISLADNRMPMQFAKAVVEGNNIILHTEGKTLSNFVYLTDAITGILTVLEKGIAGQAYNVCNDKETRSVYEIAKLVAHEIANNKISVQIEKKENMGYAPDVVLYLDSRRLRELGWTAEVDMREAYKRLVEYCSELQTSTQRVS